MTARFAREDSTPRRAAQATSEWREGGCTQNKVRYTLFMSSPPSSLSLDAALGAVLGALVGDAAGAVLEFLGRDVGPADVERALAMPGGGTWRVAPGQVTDDGELTICLLRALAESSADPTHFREAAALRYADWVASDPFDIGATTAASLGCLRKEPYRTNAEVQGAALTMEAAARERCMASKANGSLMRIAPLAVWAASRSRDEVLDAVRADVTLSHPNPSCVDAACAYVLAIASLVRTPGDVAQALEEATSWAAAHAGEEVKTWLDEAAREVRVPYTPLDGFVRIGFTHAFRHLRRGTSYEAAIRETLSGGGDTDTNACIIGAMLGARWGASAIPLSMREAVLGSDHTRGANRRPEALHPRDVPRLVREVLAHG